MLYSHRHAYAKMSRWRRPFHLVLWHAYRALVHPSTAAFGAPCTRWQRRLIRAWGRYRQTWPK